MRRVRVCTYNLKNNELRWPERRDLLGNTIADVSADLLGFQEVKTRIAQHEQLLAYAPEQKYRYFSELPEFDHSVDEVSGFSDELVHVSRHDTTPSPSYSTTSGSATGSTSSEQQEECASSRMDSSASDSASCSGAGGSTTSTAAAANAHREECSVRGVHSRRNSGKDGAEASDVLPGVAVRVVPSHAHIAATESEDMRCGSDVSGVGGRWEQQETETSTDGSYFGGAAGPVLEPVSSESMSSTPSDEYAFGNVVAFGKAALRVERYEVLKLSLECLCQRALVTFAVEGDEESEEERKGKKGKDSKRKRSSSKKGKGTSKRTATPRRTFKLWMINTHLDYIWWGNGAWVRESQMKHILRWMSKVDGDDADVVGMVFTGDFNSRPFDRTYKLLLREGWSSACYTVHGEELDTFPSPLYYKRAPDRYPRVTLDYIWFKTTHPRHELSVVGAFVGGNTHPRGEPNLYPSDHLCVVADFEVALDVRSAATSAVGTDESDESASSSGSGNITDEDSSDSGDTSEDSSTSSSSSSDSGSGSGGRVVVRKTRRRGGGGGGWAGFFGRGRK